MTILEVASMTEDQAREYLEGLRWPDGPVCPHCQLNDRYVWIAAEELSFDASQYRHNIRFIGARFNNDSYKRKVLFPLE